MIKKHISLFILILTTVTLMAQVPSAIKQGCDLSNIALSENIDANELKKFESLFTIDTIANCTKARMIGKSYPQEGCQVPLSELRYLILPHYDGKGSIKIGEMVCHKNVAKEFVDLFKELFKQKYPIERMELIDNYDGDDIKSMESNNTSSFNYRVVAGSKKLSRHAYGMAIDINPLYNPYIKGTYVSPESGKPYVNRTKKFKYKLCSGDIVYKILHDKYGFTWGGAWRSCKDYQHYEK